ncbi:MAG: ABC transporter substrate-binding protein [Patescibacteria group bacterium]
MKLLAQRLWRRFREKSAGPLKSNWHDFRLLNRARERHLPTLRQVFHIKRVLTAGEKRTLGIALLCLFVGIFWGGARIISKYRVQAPVNGGTYTEGIVGSPQFINPIFATTNDADLDITRLVFSGLMRYDASHRLVSDLAAKYSVSADNKTYTFELRKDVVWHDNEPFTARDVLYTFETIQNPAVGSPLLVSFQGVKVEAIDDYTVKFTLQEPFASFLSSLTTGILPEHIWFESQPEQMRLVKANIQPIGAGPFQFKKLLKDDAGRIYRYELTRFEKFYRKPPYLDDFIFQFYSDFQSDSGAIKAFREQKVDGLSFVPHDVRDKVDRKSVALRTLKLPQYTALFFNQERQPVLKDKDTRAALTAALDRGRILREVLQDEGELVEGPILSGFPGYSADLKKLPYSYEDANKLLDKNWTRVSLEDYLKQKHDELLKVWQEEHKDEISATTTPETATSTWQIKAEEEVQTQLTESQQGAQTFYRKNKSGKILDLELVTVNNKENTKAAELVAGFWQGVGVKVNLKLVEPREIARTVLKSREYDVLLYGEIVGADPDPYPFWHSSQIDYPGLNLSRYINRNADALIEKIRSAPSAEASVELYRKFQDLILSDAPAVFLYMPTYTYATSADLKGVETSLISHPSDRFAGVVDWYLKTDGRWHFTP